MLGLRTDEAPAKGLTLNAYADERTKHKQRLPPLSWKDAAYPARTVGREH